MRILCALLVGALFALIPQSVYGQGGGPPLITDDPDTPGPGYWEINLATIFERTRSATRLEAPLADINYGVGQRIQLKFEIPWLSGGESGHAIQTAPGNSIVGVKWRFLGGEEQRVAWSTYPQLEFNTGHLAVSNGLVEEGRQFFLPTEFTTRLGRNEVNGEVGRNFVQNGDDGWSWGISNESEFGHFELLGEVHGETIGSLPSNIIVDIGGRLKFTTQLTLLMAAGTGVHGSTDDRTHLRIYIGLQLNLPGVYILDQRTGVDRPFPSHFR
jgi:hypothetical protein